MANLQTNGKVNDAEIKREFGSMTLIVRPRKPTSSDNLFEISVKVNDITMEYESTPATTIDEAFAAAREYAIELAKWRVDDIVACSAFESDFEWTIQDVDVSQYSNHELLVHMQGCAQAIYRKALPDWMRQVLAFADFLQEWSPGAAVEAIKAIRQDELAATKLDQVMTSTEVAARLNVKPEIVRRHCEKGLINARKSGGTWLIDLDDAEALWGTESSYDVNI